MNATLLHSTVIVHDSRIPGEVFKQIIYKKFGISTYVYNECSVIKIMFPRDNIKNAENVRAIINDEKLLRDFMLLCDLTIIDLPNTVIISDAKKKLQERFPNGGWALSTDVKPRVVLFSKKEDALMFKLSL